MGKQKRQKSEPKKQKKIKPSRKDMFAELKTFQENKINNSLQKRQHQHVHPQAMEPEMDSEQQMIPELPLEGQVDMQKLQKYKHIEKEWEFVNHLISKNKINQKNAFDFQLISLMELPEFSHSETTDNAWQKMSSTLENQYKIYSYKIDAIHSITYRILNTMTRNQQNPEEENTQEKKDPQQNQPQGLFNFEGQENEVSLIHLQKNIHNINLDGVEYACSFNPRFQRTKRKFNQFGFNSLLLNSIEIDTNLQLSLTGKRINQNDQPKNQMNVRVDKMKQPLLIPKEIENLRKNSSKLIREDDSTPQLNIEEIWKNIGYGMWEDIQPREHEPDQLYIDLQPDVNMKKVDEVLKVGKKTKNKGSNLQEVSELMKDNHWMSDYDRKILGLGGTTVKKSSSVLKNEDDIDFSWNVIKRDEVLSQQTLQKEKNQFSEEVEEKHLLPVRMFNKFQIQEIMSLREEPIEILERNILDEEYLQQRTQIDIKRQQLSIRETKDKMKALIKNSGNFNELYKQFENSDNQISPSLCFLTVLHLANEHNLQLQQDSDFNIIIR